MSDCLVTAGELNAILADTPFLRSHRFSVLSCAFGECELLMPFNVTLERPGGIISGMALMGAGDVALWLAIMTQRGVDELWVTSDMQSAFLRSGRRQDVVCKAKVLRLGRRAAYGTAECRGNDTADLLSHHSLRYAKVSGRESI